MKMCHSRLILLIITGVVLTPTHGQQDYHGLQAFYKDTADKAIKHCNQKSTQHMNFLGFLPDSETSNPFYIELHLKATNCKKTEKSTHRDECQFLERRPRINCAVCNNQRTGLFIHCTPQWTVNQFEEFRKNECDRYLFGVTEPKARSAPGNQSFEGEQTGTPGP